MKKLTLTLVLLAPIAAHAAGFQISEQSGSGLGNAFAGGSASAEDPTTIFYNPAGMTYLEGTQITGSFNLINPNIQFNDTGSVAGAGKPLGGNGGNAGALTFVPNFYFKTDINDTLKFGLGVNSPFGLATEYDSNWAGRYQAIKSSLKTININPALAFKASDKLSLGLGLSAMWSQAELTNAINLGAAGEGQAQVKGTDWGFGVNLGAIYQLTEDARVGIAYRSKVEQRISGDVNFTRPAGPLPAQVIAATANGPVSAVLNLPESFSISGFSKLNNKWDLLADATWVRWSQFKNLNVNRDGGSLLASTVENWSNTVRYSVGANFHYNDTIKLRTGLAFDQEAIDNQYRTARVPGNNKTWLAFGANWKATPNTSVDAGYSHVFINDASINANQGAAKGTLVGLYSSNLDVFSVQLTHLF